LSKELEILKRKFERALLARKEAEKLLEKKSLELYASNQELKNLNINLEKLVEERTEELKSNEKYLKAVNQFATSILKHNTIDEIVWEVINLVIHDMELDDCVIYLVDEGKENLVQRAAFGSKQSDEKTVKGPIVIPLGKGIIGTVAKTGIPELINDTSVDPRYILDDQMRYSELAVPIMADGEVIGVIDTEHPEKDFYKQEHLEKLKTISGLVSSRMKNAINQEKLLLAQVSLKKLSTAIEQSPLSIFITNIDGTIEFVNPAFIETTGYSAEESIGKNSNILKSGKHTKKFYAGLWKTIKEGKKWEGEIVNKRKNSELFWVINSISPIKDSSGNVINFVAIQADISAQKQLEVELIKSKEKAEEANNAKSEFLANMSHEIRTPMNAILGLSEALYHQLDSRQHQKLLASVLSSGKLLLSLLNDILDLSRIEAGMMELSLHPIDLIGIVDEIKLLYNQKAAKENVEISINVTKDFPPNLILDEMKIKQVIFNLVGNAIKFTHKGRVSIDLNFILKKNGIGELIIKVKDTGIGIPKDQQKHIFQAFNQADLTNKKYGGAGLGLSISLRLIQKMNGTIEVESEVGKGSVFTIRLKDVEIDSSAIENKSTGPNTIDFAFEEADILIVDDIHSNIETVQHLLSGFNLNITPAYSGEQALEILGDYNPNIILCDIRMPGLSGYEVARKLKSDPNMKQIPIIAFSASTGSTGSIENNPDFDGFLLKPVSRDELVSALARFLKHKMINTETFEEQSWMSGTAEPPEQLSDKLLQINTYLEEKLSVWKTIKDQFVLYKIEQFANDLKKFAKENSCQLLLDYANQLIEEIILVDLGAIKKTLKSFPLLIKKISELANI